MKKLFRILSALLMVGVILLTACSDGSDDSSSNNSNNTNANGGNNSGNNGSGDNNNGNSKENMTKILWYDNTNEKWEGSVSWKPSNDLEIMMLASVDTFEFYVIDPNETTRATVTAKTDVSTSAYTVTGTYSASNSNLMKWADIPGTKVEARLSFTTGTTITVATQKGFCGPGGSGKTFTAADFLLRDDNWRATNGIILANCMNNINEDRYNYGDKIAKEFPVIKVAKLQMTAFGSTYTATIDWTDADFLSVYSSRVNIGQSYGNSSSGYDWRSELTFSFSPCVAFAKKDGTYYVTTSDSCYFDSLNGYGGFKMTNETTSTISNPTSAITLTITSTTGDTYTITTSLSELLEIEAYQLQ